MPPYLLFIIFLPIFLPILFVLVSKYFIDQKKQRYMQALYRDAQRGEFVFFGDSLTALFPLNEYFPKHIIHNLGTSGITTNKLLGHVKYVSMLKPRKVFLQIGTNDLGRGKRPHKVFRNIKRIITRLQKQIPGVDVIIISLYPIAMPNNFTHPIMSGYRTNADIKTINTALTIYCKDNNLTYIDIHRELLDNSGNLDKLYTTDGLHISNAGYDLISKLLHNYIEY